MLQHYVSIYCVHAYGKDCVVHFSAALYLMLHAIAILAMFDLGIVVLSRVVS